MKKPEIIIIKPIWPYSAETCKAAADWWQALPGPARSWKRLSADERHMVVDTYERSLSKAACLKKTPPLGMASIRDALGWARIPFKVTPGDEVVDGEIQLLGTKFHIQVNEGVYASLNETTTPRSVKFGRTLLTVGALMDDVFAALKMS